MEQALTLYIHIPFCEVKCGYCDFYSVPRGWEEFDLQEAYVKALCKEIDNRCRGEFRIRPQQPGPPPNPLLCKEGESKDFPYGNVQSMFFGGGTPSLLRTDLLEKILNKLREYFSWNDATEITMECNPKTIDKNGLAERKSLGINRLSMGVQSFQDRFLKSLGRIHSGDEARKTIEAAQTVGFDKISFDLMFALPGQSFEDWQSDLEIALSLGTRHLSCYNLTIEANTPFAKIYNSGIRGKNNSHSERSEESAEGRYVQQILRRFTPQNDKQFVSPLPSDDVALKQFLWTRERLDSAGLPAYEISNFAAPGHECIHNQNYWRYGDYLGFGVSAVSFAHSANDDLHGLRTANVRDLNKYIAGDTPPELDSIVTRTAMGEFVMLALRMREGVSEERFEEEFGVGFGNVFAETLNRVGAYCNTPLLENSDLHWRLTPTGLRVADSVIVEFLNVSS